MREHAGQRYSQCVQNTYMFVVHAIWVQPYPKTIEYEPNVALNWVEAFIAQGCFTAHTPHKLIIVAGIVEGEPSDLKLDT